MKADKVLKDLEKLKAKVAPDEGSATTKALKSLCAQTVDQMLETPGYKDRVSVNYRLENGGAVITATHPELGFIEFGTGIWHNQGTEYGMMLGYTPASWSESHSQWLTDPQKLAKGHGRWPYHGWQVGNPPADAFGVAKEAIREYAGDIFAGAFKK